MTRLLLFSLYTVLVFNIYASENSDSIKIQIENYILNDKLDSAKNLMPLLSSQSEIYNDIIESENPSYNTLSLFSKRITDRYRTDFNQLNSFISKRLNKNEPPQEISDVYVDLVVNHTSNLRNNNQLDEADVFNEKFIEYLDQFNQNSKPVKKARALSLIHPMVMAYIQRKLEKSEQIGNELLDVGISLNDTTLQIAANYYLFDIYSFNKDVVNGIKTAERAYYLDNLQKPKSEYYYDNIFHLLDIYLHKKMKMDESKKLIRIVFNNPTSKLRSYEILARYLNTIPRNSSEVDSVLKMVEVTSVAEFSKKAVKETEGVIFDTDFYYMLNAVAYNLKRYEEYDLAMDILMKGVFINRKIYGEDLSKTLAKHESNLVRKEKELELKAEQEKTTIYAYSSFIIGLLFILMIIAWVRLRKKKLVLEEKNTKIQNQKTAIEKRDQEKALLLKEVHHRVKNNFQIISSLLELQSKGIEDEKAKELAQEGKNRVKSMALIHQRLYQNDDLLIHFDEYIDKLIKEIASMYGSDGKTKVNLNVPKLAFDIDTAIPLGLIVNELVTNAYKYGSKEGSKIDIQIQEKEEGSFCLEVKDNGSGMPEGFNFSKAKSMGLRLVRSLSKQLHGSVNYENINGAVFQVIFKNSIARAQTE